VSLVLSFVSGFEVGEDDGAGGRGEARMVSKIELTIAPEGRTVIIMSYIV